MRFTYLTLLALIALAAGCTDPYSTSTANNGEPDRIKVQHCLIGFKSSLPNKNVSRTQEEAATLATEILASAKNGEDFEALVKKHSDDTPLGIFTIANHGFRGKQSRDITKIIIQRNGLVPAFGDVGFKLKIGEIGIAEYNPEKSKYGWHIIKRLK